MKNTITFIFGLLLFVSATAQSVQREKVVVETATGTW